MLAAAAAPVAADPVDLGEVLPLGDSITEGFPINGEAGYRLPLQQLLDANSFTYDFIGTRTSNAPDPLLFPAFDPNHAGLPGFQVLNNNNPGVGDLAGRATPMARSVAEQQIDAQAPDLVLLHAGIVDLINADTPLQVADDLDILVDEILTAAPAARLVLASTIGRSTTDTSILNRATQQRARELADLGNDITYAGLMAKRVTPDLLFDTVNPSPAGYDAMAQVWFRAIATPDTPAPRDFDFATPNHFTDHFYIPTNDNLAVRDDLPGPDAINGVLAFANNTADDTASARWNPHTTETNLLGDITLTADVSASQNDATLGLVGRVGLDATGTVDVGGYGLFLTLNDALAAPDRLTLNDLAGNELAALDLAVDLATNAWYTLALTILNDTGGVTLQGAVFDPLAPDTPLATLSHTDAGSLYAANGQFGLDLDAGSLAADWLIDNLALNPAAPVDGQINLVLYNGLPLPEPGAALVAGLAGLAIATRGRLGDKP
ncbi:MAG: GDSL-type esterase/lipase family protein [Planctomycetota bacterium]